MTDYIKEYNKQLPEGMPTETKDRWRLYFLEKDSVIFGASIFVLLVIQLLIAFITNRLSDAVGRSDLALQSINSLTYVIYMSSPALFVLAVTKRDRRELLPSSQMRKGTFPAVLMMGLGCIPVLQLASSGIEKLLSLIKLNTYEPVLEAAFEPVEGAAMWVQFFSASVLAALFEEFVFRGVLLGLLRRYGEWPAVLCCAVMFGMIHGNTFQIPFAIMFGIVMGTAVIMTGSLWTSVLLHFLNNVYSFAGSLMYDRFGEKAGSVFAIVASGVLFLLGAIGLICFLVKRADGRFAFKKQAYAFEITGNARKTFFRSPTIILTMVWLSLSAIVYSTFFMEFIERMGIIIPR